jgi:uncharacterized protein
MGERNGRFFVAGKEFMKYNLAHLVAKSLGESVTVKVQEEPQVLDEELEVGALEGEIHFTRVNGGLYAEGNLKTQVSLNCMRCLEPFDKPLNFKVAEQFFCSAREDADEAVLLITPEGVVDLSEPVRQQIWVSLPLQALCRTDCRGLCDQCGANLNHETCACEQDVIDPRLAILKELL